jgi:hypothetical protein
MEVVASFELLPAYQITTARREVKALDFLSPYTMGL